jgi:hypothetical protein
MNMIVRNIFIAVIVSICIGFFVSLALGFDYIICDGTELDCDILTPEVTVQPTNKGDSYVDSRFNTSPIRLTKESIDNVDGAYTYMSTIYSTTPLINVDSTKVIFEDDDCLHSICDLQSPWTCTWMPIRSGGLTAFCAIEPIWHPTDPNILYHLGYTTAFSNVPVILDDGEVHPLFYSAAIYKYTLSTTSRVVQHKFEDEYPSVRWVLTNTKGGPSVDGRYWTFKRVDDGSAVINSLFVYDMQTDSVISDSGYNMGMIGGTAFTANDAKSVSMSPDGDLVLIITQPIIFPEWSGGSYNYALTFYRDTWEWTGVHNGANHLDMGYDNTGAQVVVNNGGDNVYVFDMLDNDRKWHALDHCPPASSCPNYHFSFNSQSNFRGWILGSTTTTDTGYPWLQGIHMMIEINPDRCHQYYNGTSWVDCLEQPKVWRMAHVRSDTVGADYRAQAWGVLSRNMDKIVWSNNWDVGEDTLEAYYINMPDDWYLDLASLPLAQDNNHFTTSYSFTASNWSDMGSKYDVILVDTPADPNGSGITVLTSAELAATKNIRETYVTSKMQFYIDALSGSGVAAVCTPVANLRDADCNALDTVTGSTVKHDTYDWTLKDLSSSQYREALVDYITYFLITYTQFTGVFLDDVWYSLDASDFYRTVGGGDPTLSTQLTNSTNFKGHMVSLLGLIKVDDDFGIDHVLIINGGVQEQSYIDEVDGLMDEGYPHANWGSPLTFLDTDSWKTHQEWMATILSADKYYLMQPGCNGCSQAQLEQLINYSYATFLMGVPKNNTYAKHAFTPSAIYSEYYYYDLWDVDLGEPTKNYYEVPGKTNIFVREFDKGRVYVNPTDLDSGIIHLGGLYASYDYEGNIVSYSITTQLGPRTGIILGGYQVGGVGTLPP